MMRVAPVEDFGVESFFGGDGVLTMFGRSVGGGLMMMMIVVGGFVPLECCGVGWKFVDG